MKKSSGLKRYRGLIFSVSLFVVIIVSLLATNTFASRQIETNDVNLRAATEMRNSIQTIARDLYDLKQSWGDGPEDPHIAFSLTRLEAETQLFNSMLNAFLKGGEIVLQTEVNHHIHKGAENNNSDSHVYAKLNVERADSPQLRELLGSVEENWTPFNRLINSYLETARDIFSTEAPLDLAVEEAKLSSTRIYNDIGEINHILNMRAVKNATLLKTVQYIGIVITLLYLIFFLFFFIRRLLRSDAMAEEAQRETTEILNSVQEGLFLVGADMHVGNQQSRALSRMLPGIEMAQQPLESILDEIVSERNIEDTKSYIDKLFKPRIKESLIKALNPLDKVQVFIDNGNGGLDDRYLRFDFSRVYEGNDIKRVLVSVADITRTVELEQRLEREREENNRQVELLVKVLRVEPSILQSFLRNGKQVTERINNILRQPEHDQSGLRRKLESIFREAHSFKGESSALEFDQFVSLAKEMENKLKLLRDKPELSGDDFLSVAVSLDALIKQLGVVKNLEDRLHLHGAINLDAVNNAEGNKHVTGFSDNNQSAVDIYLKQFAEQAAERNEKMVNAVVRGFDEKHLDADKLDAIKNIAVQLVRNAIAHGIETPDVREAEGKTPEGHLRIGLLKYADHVDMIVEDDGKGIDTDAIREKLRQLPGFKEDPDSMSDEALFKSIFKSGMSTAKEVTEDAGQGVGMNVVKDRIKQLNGKIAVLSEKGKFTRFIVRIPT